MNQNPGATWARCLSLSLAITTGSCGGDPESDEVSIEPQRLLGGEESEMPGIVDLVGRETTGTKTRCTGVLINIATIVTSARCVQKFLPDNRRYSEGLAFDAFLTRWDPNSQQYIKSCISANSSAPNGQCVNPKPKQIYVYGLNPLPSTTASLDDDFAILYSPGYNFHGAVQEDLREVYMGNLDWVSELQIYGWDGSSTAFSRTGTKPVDSYTPFSFLMAPNSVRPCPGDRGAPWLGPMWNMWLRESVAGLHVTTTSTCFSSTAQTRGVRLRDKMGWVESIIGKCADRTDSTAGPFKKCSQIHDPTDPADISCQPWVQPPDPAQFDGCGGSGCSVCQELVTAYPRYFENHPSCTPDAACGGVRSRCSFNCPAPTDRDKGFGLGLLGTYYRQVKEITGPIAGNFVGMRWDAPAGSGGFSLNWGTSTTAMAGNPWAIGSGERTGTGTDNFAVRWSGYVNPPSTGVYQFQTKVNDGVKLRLWGQVFLDDFVNRSSTSTKTSSPVGLQKDVPVPIQLDYFDATGAANLQLLWRKPGATTFVPVPSSALAPPGGSPHRPI